VSSKYIQKRPGFQSQLERSVLLLIEQIIPPIEQNGRPGYANFVGVRPSFLLSPKGGRMELDVWIPGVPLAVEVQGEQHEKWSRAFFRKKVDWEYYKECDKVKEKVLWEMKCPFLVVKWNEEMTVQHIAGRLRDLCSAYSADRVERLRAILDDYGARP